MIDDFGITISDFLIADFYRGLDGPLILLFDLFCEQVFYILQPFNLTGCLFSGGNCWYAL